MHYRDNGLPKRKSGHWLGIIGICIALLACVFAAWGDGEGKCMERRLSHDGWVKIVGHLEGEELETRGEGLELEPYAHGHEKEYYDKNWNIIATGRSYSDIDFDNRNDDYVDCPTAPQPPAPPPPATITPPLPPQETPPPSPQKAERKRSITQRLRESGVPEEVIAEVIGGLTEKDFVPTYTPTSEYTYRDPTCDVDLSVDGIICHNYEIEDRYQLIGFPVLPLTETNNLNWFHYLFEYKLQRNAPLFQVWDEKRWLSYRAKGRSEANPEVGDILITPHLAIMVNFKDSERAIGIRGTPQLGKVISLERGTHIIGFPEVPQYYQYAKDFLIDGVEWVRLGYHRTKMVSSTDDTDDWKIKAGGAIWIRVSKLVTLDLRGSVAAAPMAPRRGTLATSWGGLKRIP